MLSLPRIVYIIKVGKSILEEMIKKLALIIGVVFCLSSCGKDVAYRIEGKLSNLEDQTLYAVFERDDYKVVDTIVCTKPGHFEIEQSQEGFNCVTLFFENKEHWTTAYLKPGTTVSISGDARYPLLLQVKGGKTNDKLSQIRKEMAPMLKELTDLSNQLNNKATNNMIEETDIASRMANVNLQLCEYAMAYVKDHPDEEASVVLIQLFFTDPDDTRKMDELLALLDPKLKSFYLTKELEQYSNRAKRTALEAEAPDFAVKDIYGKPVSLDSFPQKYLLLAFTAPWCDMCQTEDLLLDQIVMKYPKDKLDVLLISLDDNPKEVRKVLAKDSIKWNLVTDSAGQGAMLIDLYNVNALPRCFLIDDEGKIVLKTENGVEIKQTLETLFSEE